MTIKLTKKQTLVLEYIDEFIKLRGYSPSYREIMTGLELSSVSAVAEHIDNLVIKGVLKKSANSARSLEVVDTSYPETTALFKAKLQTASTEEAEILTRAAQILALKLED